MSSYSPPDISGGGGPDHGPGKKKGSKKQHANPSTRPISITVPSRTVDSHHPLNEQQQQPFNPHILGPPRSSATIIKSSAADAGESDGNTSNTSPVRGEICQALILPTFPTYPIRHSSSLSMPSRAQSSPPHVYLSILLFCCL